MQMDDFVIDFIQKESNFFRCFDALNPMIRATVTIVIWCGDAEHPDGKWSGLLLVCTLNKEGLLELVETRMKSRRGVLACRSNSTRKTSVAAGDGSGMADSSRALSSCEWRCRRTSTWYLSLLYRTPCFPLLRVLPPLVLQIYSFGLLSLTRRLRSRAGTLSLSHSGFSSIHSFASTIVPSRRTSGALPLEAAVGNPCGRHGRGSAPGEAEGAGARARGVCLESICTYMYLTRPARAHTNVEQEGDITRKG